VSDSALPLSEALLAPLLDTAGDLLRHLEPNDLPATLRRVATFDRRGLARGVARHQLLAALEGDDDFRKVVCERFMERDEVAAALRGWEAAKAVARAEAAAGRDDLPLLASALFAGRPRGYGFGLGVAVAVFESRRREQAESDDVKAMHTQIAAADEARRRAEHAKGAAEAQAQKLELELREERRSRRAREEAAEGEAGAAQKELETVRAELEREQRNAATLEERRRREAERAQNADRELRELRRQSDALQSELTDAQAALATSPAPGTGLRQADVQALADAAALAQRLADGLTGVVDHARAKGVIAAAAAADAAASAAANVAPETNAAAPAPAPRTPARPARRQPVPVPPGMLADAPEAVDAMLRTPGVVLLIDGYNVSMEGWSELGKTEQRDRLIAAVHALHLRTRCNVTVVFDGANVGPVRSARQPGVRVLFSDEGEEADDLIVEQLGSLPVAAPVLVVSTDGWVRTETERLGARAIPAHALLRVLR
jgi:predicted RNA-binding protein with PIN domain